MKINYAYKLFFTILLLQLLMFLLQAPGITFAFQKAVETETKIYNLSPAELDVLLADLQKHYPDKTSRLKVLAGMYVGAAPYCADPLTDEKKNWFPYSKTNCTMFVLYLAAFVNSSSFTEAREHMRLLHYRNGAVGFKNRYHFTSDRITDPENRYFSTCTGEYVKNRSGLKNISLVLNRTREEKSLFKGRLDNWKKNVSIDYIPRKEFSPGQLKGLPEVVGVAFVKRENWDKGIIVGHEGLLINGDLYHSSPSKGVNIIKNYIKDTFPASKWEGLILFNINEVSLSER